MERYAIFPSCLRLYYTIGTTLQQHCASASAKPQTQLGPQNGDGKDGGGGSPYGVESPSSTRTYRTKPTGWKEKMVDGVAERKRFTFTFFPGGLGREAQIQNKIPFLPSATVQGFRFLPFRLMRMRREGMRSLLGPLTFLPRPLVLGFSSLRFCFFFLFLL